MGFRLPGLLLKSQPSTRGCADGMADCAIAQPSPSAVTPTAISMAPAMRKARSPSPSNLPPIKAANSIDTSRAGATCEMGALCTAYSTST
ncbi:hypothetical protein D3C72_1660900 [compost metagenome]